ncbi:hypothetical protein HDU96_002935 [Phlyctochytrium bullatum]|nr:hypothetical protein HDU96_002935 [Phlyctochytrium bullatum]
MAVVVVVGPASDSIADIYSLPVEVLGCILKHLHPRLLPTLAAVNRHLRKAVHACDFNLAKHQLIAAGCLESIRDPRKYPYNLLEKVPFNHPSLLQHMAVVVSCCGLSSHVARFMWDYEWIALANRTGDHIEKLRLHRVQALRLALQKGPWPSPQFVDFKEQLDFAVNVAGYLKSFELREDLLAKFPDRIADDLHKPSFFFAAAEVAFLDALRQIPVNDPILHLHALDKYPGPLLLGLATWLPYNFCLNAELLTVEVVQVLLDHGANLEARNSNGLLAIHLAARDGHLKVLQMLLQRGANAGAVDLSDGCTALHFAAQFGHLDCIRVLLETNVDINAGNNDRQTPCITGVLQPWSTDSEELLRLLAKAGVPLNCDHDKFYYYLGTPLYYALRKPMVAAAHVLLDEGASPIFDDGTALHLTVRYCSFQFSVTLLERLVAMGIDVNTQDLSGYTALHVAAEADSWEDLTWLLKLEEVDRDLLTGRGLRWSDMVEKTDMKERLLEHADELRLSEHDRKVLERQK